MTLTGNNDEEKEEDSPKMIKTSSGFSGYKIKFFHYKGESRERHASHENLEKSNVCLLGLLIAVITLILIGWAITCKAWNSSSNEEYLEQSVTGTSELNAPEDLAQEITSPGSLKEIPESQDTDINVKLGPQIRLVISQRRETEDDVNFLPDSEDRRSEGNIPIEELEDVQSMAINSLSAVGDVRRNLENETGWNVDDMPYANENNKTLSRHVRDADKSTSVFKDKAWILDKMNKRAKREPLRLSLTTTFVADFYGHHFDFGEHFMDQECIPAEQWNQATACRDGTIKFKENGTSLPFYEYNSPDSGPDYVVIRQTSKGSGTFLVQKAGRYWLYLNITILGYDDSHTLVIFENDHPTTTQCQMTDKGHGHRLFEIANSMDLKKNDHIQVKTMAPNMRVRLEPHKSFLKFTFPLAHASGCPE